jgi:hypothetical protein
VKSTGADSVENRLSYFRACLKLVASLPEAQSLDSVITFPHNIGCGLGGGKWTDYKRCLEDFAVGAHVAQRRDRHTAHHMLH